MTTTPRVDGAAAGPAHEAVGAQVRRARPITLDEVLEQSALQTRVDRKYLVPAEHVAILMTEIVATYHVLEIAGRRTFAYESVYFDTDDLRSYLSTAHGHRRRFKVRTRAYLDTATCWLEVKTRGGRGETVKDRLPHAMTERNRLTGPGAAFVAARVAMRPGHPLRPSLLTRYSRATFVDPAAQARLTCDTDLRLDGPRGGQHRLADLVVVETKSPGAPRAADRALWRLGHRPVAMSKYAVGMAVLDPSLPANRWHRTIHRYFTPAAE